jgi:TP901-1 family phage major tail protein
MAAAVGRQLVVTKNNVVIAGLRTATLSWSGESIDITSGEDDGKRLLLAASGQEQLDISVEGIMKANVFRDLVLGSASKMLTDIEIEWPIITSPNTTEATLSGNFRISSYEEGAPYNDAITFSATLESSGAWTYSPEAA